MVYFHEEQGFRQWWIWAILLFVPCAAVYPMYRQVFLHYPFGTKPAPDFVLICMFAFLLLFPTWFYLVRLITDVRADVVELRFVLLWPRKIIPLAEIASCEARSYSPIWEYGGWGVRFGKRGRAFNVSGDRGVQLVLHDGSRILIGSQRAEELAAAILTRMSLVGR